MHHPALALAALALIALPVERAAAEARPAASGAVQAEKTFIVPASDGYGVGECLTGGNDTCGRIVADAWCEAQGFAAAASYGIAAKDEVTGSIETMPRSADRPVRITCRD